VRVGRSQPGEDKASFADQAAVIQLGSGQSLTIPLDSREASPYEGFHRMRCRACFMDDGHASFDGDRLDVIVQEFNRYNTRRLEIADPCISATRMGGQFRSTDPDNFARRFVRWGFKHRP